VDSVLVAVPGLRPGTCCTFAFVFAQFFSVTLLQEYAKQGVIELVTAAS
jgi:hypothetical protein